MFNFHHLAMQQKLNARTSKSIEVHLGVLLSSHLRYLNKATSPQIYKKCNWQCASTELVTCTARVQGCRARPRALLHALRHYPQAK